MNIFKYIEDLSNRIGFKIAEYFHEDKDGIEETQYGMFVILSFIFELGTSLILSLIFGYFKYFIVFQIIYCFLRSVCGGKHCNTFASCYVVTNIISFIGSVLSILISHDDRILMLGIIVFVLASVDIYYVIPKPSENSPSRGAMNLEFKRRYMKWTCIFVLASFMFAFLNINFVSSSICSSYIICYIMLSKYGEKFMDAFKF